jgi:hypothetical protein
MYVNAKNTVGDWKYLTHVFYDPKKEEEHRRWEFLKDLKSIATVESLKVASNFAELVDEFNNSANGSAPKRLFLKAKTNSKDQNYGVELEPGQFLHCGLRGEHPQPQVMTHMETHGRIWIDEKTGCAMRDCYQAYAGKPGTNYVRSRWDTMRTRIDWIEPTNQDLWIELASGAKFRIDQYPFKWRY